MPLPRDYALYAGQHFCSIIYLLMVSTRACSPLAGNVRYVLASQLHQPQWWDECKRGPYPYTYVISHVKNYVR